ncbi:MAG: SGNH/GDSL hydrolase family protein, partial [Candidatus Omnitrophica bacterium]|nr:SGNH/GDSL hydrolase family protein [Candidatus Omnitrophota bacterium]
MREHLRRYRLPLAFLTAALALALPPSDREWLTKMYYPILFGRYSTARVAWILSLLLMSLTALLRAESLLHSLPREQRWARFRVNLLIPAYTLAAAFGMVEFYFQHNPSRVSGRHDETWVESIVFQRMAERPKDEELGILGTPNMEKDNSELLEYSVPLLYAPAEWNRLPFPRVRYRSDSDGFRNDTQVNQADLVVIGDSFTHAPMIERSEIWSSVLASRLGISELNLGICGYGPQQEARALWRYGIKRGPKLVVMQVFLGNDVQDSLVFKRWKTSGMGYVEFQREQHGVRPIVPTWVFLANLARQVLPAPGKEKWDKTPGWFRPVELQLRDRRIPVGFDPDLRRLLRSEREWSRSEGLDTLILSIMEARAITTRARAKFAVMLIPTKTRVLYDFIADQGTPNPQEAVIHGD